MSMNLEKDAKRNISRDDKEKKMIYYFGRRENEPMEVYIMRIKQDKYSCYYPSIYFNKSSNEEQIYYPYSIGIMTRIIIRIIARKNRIKAVGILKIIITIGLYVVFNKVYFGISKTINDVSLNKNYSCNASTCESINYHEIIYIEASFNCFLEFHHHLRLYHNKSNYCDMLISYYLNNKIVENIIHVTISRVTKFYFKKHYNSHPFFKSFRLIIFQTIRIHLYWKLNKLYHKSLKQIFIGDFICPFSLYSLYLIMIFQLAAKITFDIMIDYKFEALFINDTIVKVVLAVSEYISVILAIIIANIYSDFQGDDKKKFISPSSRPIFNLSTVITYDSRNINYNNNEVKPIG
ncbi:hypothetical protein U3516DRAFT_770304 [Neocallimastix sp. 'constans']